MLPSQELRRLAPECDPLRIGTGWKSEDLGKQAVRIAKMAHMRPSDIVSRESFENAILVHAAISGSTNALLHIPAIAHEFGIEITGETFDRLHRGAHYLLDIRPAGKWPVSLPAVFPSRQTGTI